MPCVSESWATAGVAGGSGGDDGGGGGDDDTGIWVSGVSASVGWSSAAGSVGVSSGLGPGGSSSPAVSLDSAACWWSSLVSSSSLCLSLLEELESERDCLSSGEGVV